MNAAPVRQEQQPEQHNFEKRAEPAADKLPAPVTTQPQQQQPAAPVKAAIVNSNLQANAAQQQKAVLNSGNVLEKEKNN